MGKPTETIGIEQPAHGDVARHGDAEDDAGERGDGEADERPVERDGGVEEEIAGDRVGPDAGQHRAEPRQLEGRDGAAHRQPFPGQSARRTMGAAEPAPDAGAQTGSRQSGVGSRTMLMLPPLACVRATPDCRSPTAYSRHSSSLLHKGLVGAVGGKAQERHGQHHGEHGIVGAVGAEKADQIAEALARHDQLGADQQDEGERQRRADAVEHLGQRARHHHVPQHAQAARAHAARRPDQRLVAAAGAVEGAERHGEHAAEEDQQDLGAVAEAEPQHRDGDQRRLGHGVEHLDQRAERRVDRPPPSHGDAERRADDDRQRQAGARPPQRGGAVGDKLAAADHLHPASDDIAQRRQRQLRHEPQARREPPSRRPAAGAADSGRRRSRRRPAPPAP